MRKTENTLKRTLYLYKYASCSLPVVFNLSADYDEVNKYVTFSR